MIDPVLMSITDYLDQNLQCSCGKSHSVPIHFIRIKENALHSLPDILSSGSYKKPFFLYDSTTYSVAGEEVRLITEQAGIPSSEYILDEHEPTPDETTIGRILIHLDRSCDILIAVGSGTLNDLTRFISYQLKLPYIIIATAPSMDGFASNVAPLIVNHMKTTYEAHTPYAILGDTKLIRTAPMNMISAGIGDILGKYTCLCEWEIAHLITGEYHCQTIEGIVRKSLETVVANIDMAKSRSVSSINSIMEALVLSGIAMSFAGNSRPASGSEHHLSHYWEMMFLFQDKKPVLHGTKVGIGTIAVLRAYELLMSMDIGFNKAREQAVQYSSIQWEALIRETYGQAAASVIALEKQYKKNDPVNVLARIEALERNWNKLREVVSQMPSSDTVRDYLTILEAPVTPITVGIDRDTFLNSFRVAKELRNRFGLLQILFDLGLTDEIAGQVWDYFQSEF